MPRKKKNASDNRSKSSFIVLLLMLIILGMGGVSGYMFYQIHKIKSQGDVNKDTTSSTEKNIPAPSPIYIELETFTVSLKPTEGDSDRVLYVGLTLRLKDEKSKVLIGQFMPEIRSRLLLLFSQQTGAELATDNGKLELINKIKNVVNLPLTGQQSAVVNDVLFNAFIIR